MSRLAPGGLVDGLLLDLGVSSHQLDEATRGFSFMRDGPLDMRMDAGSSGTTLTAEAILNDWDPGAIADVLWKYGEERESRRIARAIVAARGGCGHASRCRRPLTLTDILTRIEKI